MENKTFIYANSHFILRSDSLENWQTKNPILLKNEIVHVSDAKYPQFLKRGDGVTPWNELPYWPEDEVAQWKKLDDRSADALEIAQSVQEDAITGKFKGEKGEKGDTGAQGIPGNDYILTDTDKTEIADIVLSNFVNVAVMGQ